MKSIQGRATTHITHVCDDRVHTKRLARTPNDADTSHTEQTRRARSLATARALHDAASSCILAVRVETDTTAPASMQEDPKAGAQGAGRGEVASLSGAAASGWRGG